MKLEYTETKKISLKEQSNEKWLQDIIEDDPTIIGLGEIEVYSRERKQSSGGRIDFLMINREQAIMYEVELMLGSVDESHIIRTIEYWDIERRRFPTKDHRAVIIAEDITNRFFNVISLMNKSIPIIAIQLNAFEYEDKVFLDFVNVLDIYESPEDEDIVYETVDRIYWLNKFPKKSMDIMDEIIEICQKQSRDLKVAYNKYSVSLGTDTRSFLWLRPRKTNDYCHVELYVGESNIEKSISLCESIGLIPTVSKDKKIKFPVTSKIFKQNINVIQEIMNIGLNQINL